MHEVAEARPGALPHLVLPAARLPKVRHRGELGVYRPAAEPAVVQVVHSLKFQVFNWLCAPQSENWLSL